MIRGGEAQFCIEYRQRWYFTARVSLELIEPFFTTQPFVFFCEGGGGVEKYKIRKFKRIFSFFLSLYFLRNLPCILQVCFFYYLTLISNQKNTHIVSYELMCCLSRQWSRRHPTTLPQGISSNVHLLFKRLLFGGCTSGNMRELGCESRVGRWVAVRSRKTM